MSEFIAERMWPDPVVERSIFGTDDPDEIWRLARELCPEAIECFAFEVSVGALFGLRLHDGMRIALKIHVRQNVDALESVQRVQGHLFRAGFPCPEPLDVRGQATLEQWCDAGVYRDAHEPSVRRVIAEHLVLLFDLTRDLQPVSGLEPFFPRAPRPLWPVPHNVLFDFDATTEDAEWIDDIARAAKPRRNASPGELVIGHGDWTVKHFRFEGLRPTVVYDWDSLYTDHETVFVGAAAATFTYTDRLPVSVWPTVAEADVFLDEYEAARVRPFSLDERRAAQAAAVYSRAYSARCTHALGKDARKIGLEDFAERFL